MRIRSASVLPAARRDVEFTTSDGYTLVGELSLPEGSTPVGTLAAEELVLINASEEPSRSQPTARRA